MDDTTLKVFCAALLHDIGKAGNKNIFGIDDEYIARHENVYLPVRKGRYSHYHAIYSAAIIEKNAHLFPPEFTSRQWGEGDPLVSLVAGHHNPASPLQWIIAVADRISSGWDRDIFEKIEDEIPASDYLNTRLFSVYEQLLKENDEYVTPDDFQYSYKLSEMTPENLFPLDRRHLVNNGYPHGVEEYRMLYQGFIRALSELLPREESPELWIEHFDSILMVYTWAVPAARVGKVIPDVSLYDHSRTTAALASSLYLYHNETDTLRESSIRNYEEEKFLIISGDFYGIQDFIFKTYADTKKHRSKILRGRSLYVSLLTELAADMICRRIGLHHNSAILNTAGKFLIIAPNTEWAKKAVQEVDREINRWLFEKTFGESCIGITSLTARPLDFVERNFQKLWDKITAHIERKKFSKLDLDLYGGAVENYLQLFNNSLHSPICPFCGKRPSDESAEYSPYVGDDIVSSCKLCRDHIFLGAHLVKNRNIAILSAHARCDSPSDRLLEPIYDKYQITFPDSSLGSLARNKDLFCYWDIQPWSNDKIESNVTIKMINGYVPVYSENDKYDERILFSEKTEKKKLEAIDQIKIGDPKTFTHISAKALNISHNNGSSCTGVDALGVCKADVDNLGILMSCGLRSERFTISRLATLSRLTNAFFAYYLPHFLMANERYSDVYTVFGGGDDLFLIGPWNAMLELATKLVESFASYTCYNENIHLSAGII
ncbi:MAG TPA: type III-A CRISPR-associated protein Cas10/Csm1, partial [Deltaproteobacteria bacterium]|nr:type III-A CRISPR-associated protein Cas10/Csm1 [Deltaproteobacteria bacterium]